MVKELLGCLLGSGLMLVVSGAQSADNSELVGHWNGILVVDDMPQPVKVDISDLKPGERGINIAYTLPRHCAIQGQYGGDVKDGAIFYVDGVWNNGWCAKTKGGHIKVSLTESGKLKFKIKSKGVSESAILDH